MDYKTPPGLGTKSQCLLGSGIQFIASVSRSKSCWGEHPLGHTVANPVAVEDDGIQREFSASRPRIMAEAPKERNDSGSSGIKRKMKEGKKGREGRRVGSYLKTV